MMTFTNNNLLKYKEEHNRDSKNEIILNAS
jgi:hypothetical protein